MWILAHKGNEELKRYGHTTCVWNNKLLVVGGSKMYNREYKRRDCLEDLWLFDPNTASWQDIDTSGLFTARRGHIACMVGTELLVSGGIDAKGNYLTDDVVLPLNRASSSGRRYRWTKLLATGDGPKALAYSTCECILAPERSNSNSGDNIGLYTLPPLRTSQPSVRFAG
jgi:hypothetical protein